MVTVSQNYTVGFQNVNLISNRFLDLSDVSFPSDIRGMERRVKESKSTPYRISKNSDS